MTIEIGKELADLIGGIASMVFVGFIIWAVASNIKP